MSTQTGELLADRYRLVRRIGYGGMAEVWEANDELLHRRVAIKSLHPHLRTPSNTERFRHEAAATARLGHPNIVTVYDTISQRDRDAIVMELIDGQTLRFVLDQRHSLPLDRALSITRAVAEAL